jgi:cysteine-rich repeat protein
VRAALLTTLAFSLCLPVAGVAGAQAPLVIGLGGPADFGTIEIEGDDASEIVDITAAFPGGMAFYGETFDRLTVTANGLVSLGGPRGMPPRAPFPVAGDAILAAWSYDMLPEGTGSTAGSQRVYVHVETGRVVITWYLVPARGGVATQLVSAQMILTPGAAGVTEMELRYNRCDWTIVGSGTLHAQAGISRGNAAPGEFMVLPGSGTALIADLCESTNTTTPGVWRLVISGTSVTATCGDGLRQTGESCDDGNTMDGDSCPATCVGGASAVCGNNIIEAGEECDDGDRNPRDGCDEDCQTEPFVGCGDGVVTADEECDDGNGDGTDACVLCNFAVCGDEFLWEGREQCDDGNTNIGDGCDESCFIEVGPGVDAGPRPDVGGFDAGRQRGYTYEGGGCGCRAHRGSPRDALTLLVILGWALAARRRKR